MNSSNLHDQRLPHPQIAAGRGTIAFVPAPVLSARLSNNFRLCRCMTQCGHCAAARLSVTCTTQTANCDIVSRPRVAGHGKGPWSGYVRIPGLFRRGTLEHRLTVWRYQAPLRSERQNLQK